MTINTKCSTQQQQNGTKNQQQLDQHNGNKQKEQTKDKEIEAKKCTDPSRREFARN